MKGKTYKQDVQKTVEPAQPKQPSRSTVRITMKPEDKQRIHDALVATFKACGAPEDKILEAITHGSTPMELWIQRYIARNTPYLTEGITDSAWLKGCFAWMYYKATARMPFEGDRPI